MYFTAVVFVVYFTSISAAPADEPIRVDLPVYNEREATPKTVSENQPSGLEAKNDVNSIFSNNFAGVLINKEASVNVAGNVFSQPVTTLEGAILETEGIGSQKLSAKENLQNIVAGLFQPKPIVDTIKEEEKYGNNGDKFYTAGQVIVGGAENVSNLINSALEVPSTIFKSFARSATEKLNNLGGRIIGLYNK